MEKTNVARALPSYYCVSGRNSSWKNPPQGLSNPTGTKPPSKTYLFAPTSLDLYTKGGNPSAPQDFGFISLSTNEGIPYVKGTSDSDFCSSTASWLSIPSLPAYENLKFGEIAGDKVRYSGDSGWEWDVYFDKAFSAAPKVVLWFKQFKCGRDGPFDVKLYEKDITAEGFSITCEKDSNTKILDVVIGWFAWIPSQRFFGSTTTITGDSTVKYYTTNTTERNVLTGPQPGINGGITPGFIATPQTMLGINRMKFDRNYNIRLQAEMTFVYRHGYQIRAKTWSDSRMYELGLTFIIAV